MSEETPPQTDDEPMDELAENLDDFTPGTEPADEPVLGGDSEPDQSQSVIGRLSNAKPNPDIEEVGELYNSDYWRRYLMRGVMKITGEDGEPAWLDLARGVLGGATEMNDEQTEDDERHPAEAEAEAEGEYEF